MYHIPRPNLRPGVTLVGMTVFVAAPPKVSTTVCSLEHIYSGIACNSDGNDVCPTNKHCLLPRHHPTDLIETCIHLIVQNEVVVDVLEDGDGIFAKSRTSVLRFEAYIQE